MLIRELRGRRIMEFLTLIENTEKKSRKYCIFLIMHKIYIQSIKKNYAPYRVFDTTHKIYMLFVYCHLYKHET